MIEQYLTVKETAEKWNINQRTVQAMCNDGRIPDVKKFGKAWAIPADVERPIDNRLTTGEYRNWRKGKNELKNYEE